MNKEKLRSLAKGVIFSVPGMSLLKSKGTGGTINSRYCYSAWLRHLIKLNANGGRFPDVVAELGPGDSLGIGFAALLTGVKKYYALDIVNFFDTHRNLEIFEEIVSLFRNRTAIPDNIEFPGIHPEIENYDFPSEIISETQLEVSLSEQRLDLLRDEIRNLEGFSNKYIFCYIPWYDSKVIKKNSVDFIYSQAVLEHVEDLENTYSAMHKWLKSSGKMSHDIDFRSHNITTRLNGHWTFSDFEWKIVMNGTSFFINRRPFTYHIKLQKKIGFKILEVDLSKSQNHLKPTSLARIFKNLNSEELTTNIMYILSEKRKSI